MSSYEKLKLLIWKNFLLQRRHKWQTVFEIASPVIFSLFLILTRCLVDPKAKPDTSYSPFLPTYLNMSGRHLGNLTSAKSGTLAFSPENNLTRSVVNDAMLMVAEDNMMFLLTFLFGSTILPEPMGYKNAREMEIALTKPKAMDKILVGIQFDDKMASATKWPDDVTVSLRFPAVMRTPMVEHPIRASWRTNLLFPLFPRPGPRDPEDMYGGKTPGYSPEMFLAVQHAISQEIIKHKTGNSVNTKVYLQRFPQIAYRDDQLLVALERFISMIIMLCFAYTFVNTVRVVTAEKELQLKETMTIMGLPSWLHWLAWFIKQFSFLCISVVLIVILLKIPFNRTAEGDGYSVLTFTPWTVLLFFMLLFIIASLAFSFMVSVFFTRANTAASFMGLAWFTTYSVFMLTQVLYEDISLSTKLVLSLISNTAMGYAFQMIIMCEGTSRGLQWSDFFTPISYHDSFQPGHVVAMLILDTILYLAIAMYMEKIRPGLYGVPLPWYFPVTKSFWKPNKMKVAAITRKDGPDAEYNDALLKVIHDEEPKGVPMGVNIQNLTKVYKGKKKAVDDLNLRMYENEITVLLGHNGAGKTTTISMLTGMVAPSSGSAQINGYNIVTETKQARKSLGICPQHNVLFPDLTVAEHIIFYSRLKGVPINRLRDEVNHFVKLLELDEKRNVLSKNLSGGQKRRLSVGAAMCGSSRVVLLDEPTSGLDPAARRALWDLLQKEKKGRTMILTTHFMDEADVLGDRIAIMSGGRLQCVGTPYFLKKHYGIGYKLTIVKADECNVEEITRFFKKYVPDITENTNIGSELTYIVSNDNVSKFPEMLKEFEEEKDYLHVSSYGLSVTSLEEVFMKAGAEHAYADSGRGNHVNIGNDGGIMPLDGRALNTMETDTIEKVRGFKLLRNHIKAMFLKLAYNTMRNKLSALIQFVTPIINITISVIISRSWKFMSQLPPLVLSLESGFRQTQTLMSQSKNLTDGTLEVKTMNAYKDYFKSSTYPGLSLTDIGTSDLGKFYLKLCEDNLARVRYEVLTGATFTQNNVIAWFSNYGYHDSAISLALANNAILRALSPNSSLTIINHPLPYSIENLVKVMASGSSMGFQFAFNIGFCMAFVTAFLVLFVIKERISGAKLLQRVSGVRPAIMWTTALIWDWVWLFLVYLSIIFTLACFQEETLSTPAELGRVLLVLMVFSLAIIPLHYMMSFYFEAPATGFSKMCFFNIFTGSMPFLITEVLRLPEVGSPFYANIFDWVFSPLPIYCISRSFRDMSVSSFSLLACEGLCNQLQIDNCTRHSVCHKMKVSICCIEDNPYLKWSEPGIGRYLFMMTLVGVVTFTILLVKEYELCNKVFYKSSSEPLPPVSTDEDDDVATERASVQALTRTDLTRFSLVCKDLTKFYHKFLAVNRISFGVRRGECFGLLGVNGAGKTSTFRMLTGDSRISSGDAFVHGINIKTNIQDVHRHIGYCPQFDALFDNLTARETLRIFCLLRGIPERVGAASALHLANTLGFIRHYDKKVQECSGGTKRKISTSVALLGDSTLVYLDEPTTGMDPASKRLVWTAISEAVLSGRSIVLTSHSMEECEALCSRLTVMVNGRLYCLGPLQHLKSKFSQGYTLVIKCKSSLDREFNIASINQYIIRSFTEAKLIESYLGISTYYLKDAALLWWKIFHVMEEARTQFPIEDYSVSQTTLEQVFLRFTRLQETRKMSALNKLKLLIWKNFLLQRRHKWQTLFEILSPVIFALLLIVIRCLLVPKSIPSMNYPPFLPTYFNISGHKLGNLTSSTTATLAFSPETPLTKRITMDTMATIAEENFGFILTFLLPIPKGYKNAKDMETALTQPNAMDKILVGIQFEDSMINATHWPDNITIALRFPAVMRAPIIDHPLIASWKTNLLFPIFPQSGPREPEDIYGGQLPGYSSEMFLAIQHAISKNIIKQKSGKSFNTNVYLQRLPQLSSREDPLLVALERFVPIVLMLGFVYTYTNTVKAVTTEKELQLKETMAIMGLPPWIHWLAWFIKQFSFIFISTILIVIVFKIPFDHTATGEAYSILTFTPWTVLLFFMVLFVAVSLAFSFMISVFFSRANTAASFMAIIWFGTFSVFMFTQIISDSIDWRIKMVLSLLSNTAIGYAFQMIIVCEGTARGLQWSDMFTPVSYHDHFLPGYVVLILIVDTFLYMSIALYVEKIRPGEYGVPLPWYFPFTKSFWIPNGNKITDSCLKEDIELGYKDALLKVVHDEEPNGVPVGVNIQNLTKIYKGRRKAVDNLSLRMYENEITVLLGHNGAGKTTTISMLTGMVPPTSGSAIINGHDIVRETELARKSIGICPQHNVLFPDLTVAEHIIFYSKLKGLPENKIRDEVDHFVKLLELEDKKDVISDYLSGGQKRRLSVGAAMCGSSRVVILDEPTSGLDPAARRALWDLLQKEKKGRTMILTTHFMDEADVLGDRIAIMKGGRLQCFGTPYFLKKHYGIGYKLTIVKGDGCNVNAITNLFKPYIPSCCENTNIGSELTYILPNEFVHKFPYLLRELEEKKELLYVSSYGLSVTRLEEVFMKDNISKKDKKSNISKKDKKNENESSDKVKGIKLLINHIHAMFLKLAYNTLRNKGTGSIQIIWPIVNIVLSMIIASSWKFLTDLPPLKLSLESGFEKTQTLVSQDVNLSDASLSSKVMAMYKDYFMTSNYPEISLTNVGTMDLGKFYLKLTKSNPNRVRYETLAGASFANNNITAWFSNYGYHDSAISLALVNNAVMRTHSPNSTLNIVNYPLPYSFENMVEILATGSSTAFLTAFSLGFCLAVISSFLVIFYIKERVSGAKLLQKVSGLKPAVMWITALIWDSMWLLVIHIIIVLTLACFQESTMATPQELGRILLVLMVFSFAIIPLHYLASFFFKDAATGFAKMVFVNIFSGSMLFLLSEVLRMPQLNIPFYANLSDYIFSFLPIYCVARSLRQLSVTSLTISACEGLCRHLNEDNCTRYTVCKQLDLSMCCIVDDPYLKWEEPGIARYLFMMFIVGFTALSILLLKEYEVMNKLAQSGLFSFIYCVYAEYCKRKIISELIYVYLDRNLHSLVICDSGVHHGECFGLLGVNGAGKTSTFRMLTGDCRISNGDAFVLGHNIKTNIQDVHRNIGYCPQFDALFDNLSARETLRIFCLLRGIPERVGAARAMRLAISLGFIKHYDKKVRQNSGGTKRKISAAIALLGDSPVIFLDEPTTGMDPASKRLVWSAIIEAVETGRSVILTSHSMEECEALCSKLTVMVRGNLQCLGSLQHLKNKFSQGYTLMVKCESNDNREANLNTINQYVTKNFTYSRLIESYLGVHTYYLQNAGLPWWRVFYIMEEACKLFPIEDYSVSQTTLEQVFLEFTR
ncbi:hypothetical protein K1T71_007208 [Dendrolimus kikuchii]|uniref:Uncharacterized protein n=1 Tax=Dendrolimus kikuchii TaxID=765133 RepID=A0ACC1CZS8_9NEOP|nr:hypothetical protein K1T71_007208 [Dendrolimus kikuchii]